MSQTLTARWLICRICLKSENKKLYNIFEPIAEDEIAGLGTILLDKIELCGAIKLNQKFSLPNKICSCCVLLLRAAYKFRVLCQQSQDQLMQFFSTVAQKGDSEETVEINFDSGAEEQKSDEQEEVGNEQQTEADYVIEESELEFDNTSYEPEQSNGAKNNGYISTIEEDEVEIQELSDYENTQYVVEEFINERSDDDGTVFKYEEDFNAGNIIVEEASKKSDSRIYKCIPGRQPPVKRKRKHSQSEAINGIYSCMFCDNAYTDKTKYNNHMKIHAKNKPHECEICKKRFSTTPQLSRHMNSHTGNRPYKCQFCDASFGDPSTKIKHERIHTNERPYKCCLCHKAFAYSNVLKVHMMTHTGERPHTCEYCGKSFSQVHHKNAHEKRHTNVNMALSQNSTDVEYMGEDDLRGYKIEEII